MYNKTIICLLLIFITCHGMEVESTSNHVAIRLRKELFYYFAPQLCNLKGVEQTTYDENTQMATCWFRKPKDTRTLLNDTKLVKFLDRNKMPLWYKKDTQLILTAFVKLEQIMDTGLVAFNKQLTGVILNPRIEDPDLRVLIDSVGQSTRICAKIAGIPFLK